MATKQQTSKVAGTITEFQEVFETLSNEDRQWMIKHGKVTNELIVDLIKNSNKEKVLSEVLGQISFDLHPGSFNVGQNFSRDNTSIKICYVSSNFTTWFGDLLEESAGGINKNIYSRRVRREPIKDKDSVITELGAEKANISFKEIYWLLLDVEIDVFPAKKKLISKTAPNKFLVCNKRGLLCLVDFTWQWNGWRINAYPSGMIDLFFQPDSITFSHLP